MFTGAHLTPATGNNISRKGATMPDTDRIKGAANQAKGAVKEGVGKLVGDQKLQAEGKADKVTGKVQSAVGGAKDAVKGN
jgi:uncharacterized protein YjbJ (UPF0337 family)